MINHAVRSIKRAIKRVVNLTLAVLFLAVLLYAGVEVGPEIYDLVIGCDTELCCDTCDPIPVTRVIDGDTFVSEGNRVRTFGYDSPEIGQPCADEATERMRELAGEEVRAEPGPRGTDLYGRTLAYVYTASGASIDERMVRAGLAWAWTKDGQHRELLMMLEQEARSAGAGCLW